MKLERDFQPSLAGSLLVAHPQLADPNFQQSVVLLSVHNNQEGSIGVVINSPLDQTISEFDEQFDASPLAGIPLYYGGPIAQNQIILTAWQWLDNKAIFKFHFGISEEKALYLLENDPQIEVRAFLGYTGWSDGQLESELGKEAWLLSTVKSLDPVQKPKSMWKSILSTIKPELLFLADVPDDPSLN